MKKIWALVVAIAVLFAFGSISYAAEDTVGFVDDLAILQASPKFQQATKQLNDLETKKSNDAKAAFDKEKDEVKKRQIVQNLELEMRTERDKLFAPILKEVNEIISKVAKQKNVTIVVNKELVLYGGTDLTQDVIAAIKK
ncbi:MAG: OmpH family outer membrane protein [Synergistes sp.]|nr:OmpH family outer membrane protein [Synergistes sp.]